jgi:hypothetical protein
MSARNFTITLTVPADDQFDMTNGDYTLEVFQEIAQDAIDASGWTRLGGSLLRVTDISITEVKS